MVTDPARTDLTTEDPESETHGVGIALEYIGHQAKLRGLPLTAHLAEVAAEACWDEIEQREANARAASEPRATEVTSLKLNGTEESQDPAKSRTSKLN